jgi:hypothetical protein
MANYPQNDFIGGLNLINDSAKLQADEYPFLSNGRVRFNRLRPTKKPVSFESELPPFSNAQAIFGFGNYLLVFGDGKAYWRDFSANPSYFNEVSGVNLDTSVPRIYAAAFPASTINYQRKSGGSAGSLPLFGVEDSGSVAALIATDGLATTQPILILPNGTSRVTNTYAQWTNSDSNPNREYVPAGGTFPIYAGGRLYMAGRDGVGRLTKIFRSVSGRPFGS